MNLILLALIAVACEGLVVPARSRRVAVAPLSAKAKAAAKSLGGFGAPTPKAPPKKTLKSLVLEAQKTFDALDGAGFAADVYVAAAAKKSWFFAGRVRCAEGVALAAGVNAHKGLIFTLAKSLHSTLLNAPNLVAAIAPMDSVDDVTSGRAQCVPVERDEPAEASSAGYEPHVYQDLDKVVRVDLDVAL